MPSDLRFTSDGSLDIERWPDTKDSDLLHTWLTVANKRLKGWGVSSGVFMKMSGPIDIASLPQSPQASLDKSASAFLLDVDPNSPERGRRFPLHFEVPPPDRYTPENLLAAIPVFGYIRRPATIYALVITTDVKDAAGTQVGRSRQFHDMFGDSSHFQPLVDQLKSEDFDLDRVAGAAVFKTMDHNELVHELVTWADKQPMPQLAEPWTVAEDYQSYQVLTSSYEVPIIQAGDRPYITNGDGLIVRDPNTNEPVVQERQKVRLALTIPKRPQPAGGFPLTIYMHGSGGEWYQAINRGPVPEVPESEQPEPVKGTGPAEWLARRGVATIAFDFPLHGNRSNPPDTTGLYLYNLLGNVDATFDNFSVAVMELTMLSKLVLALQIDPALAPTLDAGGEMQIHFNPDRLTAMGQSMGTTLGVVWAGVDPRVKGVLFSGAGGILVEIAVTAVEPVPLKGVVELALGLREGEHIHLAHPVLHAMQNLWDLLDPIAKAPYVAAAPHEGLSPKHIMMTAGIMDGYFNPRSEAAMAVALGVPLAGDSVDQTILDTLLVGGREKVDFPVHGNMNGVTGAVLEFSAPNTLGHYVVFNQDGARHQYTCFLASVGTPEGARIEAAEGLDDPCP